MSYLAAAVCLDACYDQRFVIIESYVGLFTLALVSIIAKDVASVWRGPCIAQRDGTPHDGLYTRVKLWTAKRIWKTGLNHSGKKGRKRKVEYSQTLFLLRDGMISLDLTTFSRGCRSFGTLPSCALVTIGYTPGAARISWAATSAPYATNVCVPVPRDRSRSFTTHTWAGSSRESRR